MSSRETGAGRDASGERRPEAGRSTVRPRAGRPGAAALAGALALLVAACSNPLNVENPNKLTDEDISEPTAMSSVVNGAQASVTRGLQAIGGVYATASDEVTWIGSRDAWNQLDQGNVDDPVNEFTDAAFPYVAEGRFMADRAIEQGRAFDDAGTIPDRVLLGRAYLYGAIIYTSIAEQFDDFVLPEEPDVAVPPVGPGSMDQLFGTAIDYATQGIQIARDAGNSELEARLLAVRARAKHSRSIWQKLNPPGSAPADPLVANQGAADDANAVLGMVSEDWRYQLTFQDIADITVVDLSFADQVNERGELQIGAQYVSVDPENLTDITGVTIQDPIDGISDPVITWKLAEFHDDATFSSNARYAEHDEFSPMTVVSAREMHLIAAEHELATAGDNSTFRGHINDVRDLDGLSNYDGSTVTATEILRHERRVNLFLMFRRLGDMYRFGFEDPAWQSQAPASRDPGTMLPITITEIRSNPNVSG